MKKIMFGFGLHLGARFFHGAFAQTAQPTGGASSQGNVAPGASEEAGEGKKDSSGNHEQGHHRYEQQALTPR